MHDKVEKAIFALIGKDLSYLKEVQHFLESQLAELRSQGFEPDFRRGTDTYGYGSIEGDLEYISDRWNCEFRIQWLLDGLNYGHFDKFTKENSHAEI